MQGERADSTSLCRVLTIVGAALPFLHILSVLRVIAAALPRIVHLKIFTLGFSILLTSHLLPHTFSGASG